MTFYEDIIPVLKDDSFDMKKWTTKKMEIANTHSLKTIPSNIDILLHIPDDQVSLVKAKLLTKPTRTISGVSPVAIM